MMRFLNFKGFTPYINFRCSANKNAKGAGSCIAGFTLVEVLVSTALMVIVFLGIFGVYQLGLRVVGQSKNRIIATYIANGELEKIRNLPYESIGVQGSFPDGVLVATSTIVQNNATFTMEKRVDYVIDSADGLAMPDDDCPNDYKKAEIKVSALGNFAVDILMVTDISPENLAQECSESGGIISVSVFDAFGVMVSSPLIEIKNPATNETLKTASPTEGTHYFPLATSTYEVVVSKTGYSQERTYGTDEVTTPINPHPIVLEGQLTEISFSIDRVSSMTVEARGSQGGGYPVIHNVTFNLRGEKLIGYDVGGDPVYKYSQNHTTNGPGQVAIADLEWDSYYFSIVAPALSLTEIESPPGVTTTQPIALAPNTNLTARLVLSAENSLLLTVQNSETLEPVFSAAVRLYNAALGYDATQYTDTAGQTYFIPLQEAVYNLEVQASGYTSVADQVSVSGETTRVIQLQQIE